MAYQQLPNQGHQQPPHQGFHQPHQNFQQPQQHQNFQQPQQHQNFQHPPQHQNFPPPPHQSFQQSPHQSFQQPPPHQVQHQPSHGGGPQNGIFTPFIKPFPTTIVLKEHVLSLSGDSFSIKTVDGTPILQVEGKLMSISGRKRMCDMAGTHLFDIVKEHFHLHTTFRVEDPSGKPLMMVKSSFKLLGSKATATFTNPHTGQEEVYKMEGGMFDYSANITDANRGGAIVARIDRKLLSGKDIFFGQQTYAVEIQPHYDAALVAAMCICLDEKNNEA